MYFLLASLDGLVYTNLIVDNDVLFLLVHATSMQVSIASNGIITCLSIRKTRVKLFVYIISHLIRWFAVCTSLFVNVHSCKLELI